MIWIDYSIESMGTSGQGFRVRGEWEGEVMGIDANGNPKDSYLYKPGDVFIVGEDGWLRKTDQLNTLLLKYEESIKK